MSNKKTESSDGIKIVHGKRVDISEDSLNLIETRIRNYRRVGVTGGAKVGEDINNQRKEKARNLSDLLRQLGNLNKP